MSKQKKARDLEKAVNMFSYDNGQLVWKDRPRSDFPTETGYKLFRTRFLGKVAGTQHIAGYWQVIGLLAHRIIWAMHNGQIPDRMEIDHINGDKLDNRIENLRLTTPSQNQCNRMAKKSPHGMKGISFDKRRERRPWSARIVVNGTQYPLGAFATKEEAYAAYCKAAKDLHGDHFPEGRIPDPSPLPPPTANIPSPGSRCHSGHKNIQSTRNGTFCVRLTVNYKSVLIGTYKTIEEAIAARDEATIKYKKSNGVGLADSQNPDTQHLT